MHLADHFLYHINLAVVKEDGFRQFKLDHSRRYLVFFCNICKDIKSDLSWISGSSCNNHLWLTFMCKFSNLIVVQYSVIIDVVRNKII